MDEIEDLKYIWREADCGARVDRVLATAWGVSRTTLQRWMEQGHVRAGASAVTAREKVAAGTEISALRPAAEPSGLAGEKMDLDILFEDEDVVVVNKPAGMVVHPGAGCREGTLAAALLYHCKGSLSGVGGVERPGIVHRLDKDTSGVLVAAKNDAAHVELSRQFHDRETKKIYLAWVFPGPAAERGTWDGPIGRHRIQRHKMVVMREPAGRPSRTDFRVVRRVERFALLELELHTGRTHQIRVHASHAGCPVLGDKVYGGRAAAMAERQLLHAWKLVFQHPRNGQKVELEAKPPNDMIEPVAATGLVAVAGK